MRALIANEPCTYREVLVDTLQQFRPQVEVSAVEPDGLGAEIVRLRPHLVVCSRASVVELSGPFTWVTLYPDGENRAEIFIGGKRETVAGIGFGDLLLILDKTELLCRST